MTSRSLAEWALIGFVIVSTALTGAGVIGEPWSQVITSIVGSLYAWGLVRKPAAATTEGGGQK